MSGAIGQAADGLVAAKAEIVCGRIADWPAAFACSEVNECAALGALDRCLRDGCLRERGLQDATLRQYRRAPWPRLDSDCGRRAPPQMQTMDFSDDGVARQPDLAGNLAARKSGFDIAPQLIHTFGSPGSGLRVHAKAPRWSSRLHAARGVLARPRDRSAQEEELRCPPRPQNPSPENVTRFDSPCKSYKAIIMALKPVRSSKIWRDPKTALRPAP